MKAKTCIINCVNQFSSVAQSCLTLCNPMDCSMPGFPVHHQLPEFTQTHVHWPLDHQEFHKIRFQYLCIKKCSITVRKIDEFQVRIAKKFPGKQKSHLSLWDLKCFKFKLPEGLHVKVSDSIDHVGNEISKQNF